MLRKSYHEYRIERRIYAGVGTGSSACRIVCRGKIRPRALGEPQTSRFCCFRTSATYQMKQLRCDSIGWVRVSPSKGSGRLIVGFDVAHEFAAQIGHGFEDSTGEHPRNARCANAGDDEVHDVRADST